MPARRFLRDIPPPASSTLRLDGSGETVDGYVPPSQLAPTRSLWRGAAAIWIIGAALVVAVLAVTLLAGDGYRWAMIGSALTGALFFVVGCAALAAFTRFLWCRVPLFVRVIVLILTGGFIVLGGLSAVGATADVFSPPALARGIVTAHQIQIDTNTSAHQSSRTYNYVITVNGQEWGVGSDAYNRFGVGSCIALTYGSHTRIVTDARACPGR